jgi:hypothetical protein
MTLSCVQDKSCLLSQDSINNFENLDYISSSLLALQEIVSSSCILCYRPLDIILELEMAMFIMIHLCREGL